MVTNLRLASGQYVSPGQPLLSFLESGARWISADMRENQLGNVTPGQRVTIALDVKPGKLFHGQVQSVGWGVSQGNEAPTGQLSSVPAESGWLREPQRFPVRILVLPDEAKAGIDIGGAAPRPMSLIFTDDHSILNPIGRCGSSSSRCSATCSKRDGDVASPNLANANTARFTSCCASVSEPPRH
jgi:hypothetical protein